MASTTRSAVSTSPSSRADADDVRAPRHRPRRPPPARRPRTPRRTVTRGSSAAAAAMTASNDRSAAGHEPQASSPPGAESVDRRRRRREQVDPHAAGREQPRRSGQAAPRRTPGGSRANRLCGWWNCATPLRSHDVQASPGAAGGGSGSASSTVTSCPSRASIIAEHRPMTPPPHTTIDATSTAGFACPPPERG